MLCPHQLEKELTFDKFVEWTRPDMMDEIEVQVGLPRFKMEENYDMKNVLVSMGMVEAFDPRLCDFSGITILGPILNNCRFRPYTVSL